MAEKVSEISLVVPLEPAYIIPQGKNTINFLYWINFMDPLTSIVSKRIKVRLE